MCCVCATFIATGDNIYVCGQVSSTVRCDTVYRNDMQEQSDLMEIGFNYILFHSYCILWGVYYYVL